MEFYYTDREVLSRCDYSPLYNNLNGGIFKLIPLIKITSIFAAAMIKMIGENTLLIF